MNASGKAILIEECHWGGGAPGSWGDGGRLNRGPNKVPKEKWCPYNFFRTSNDIQAEWSRGASGTGIGGGRGQARVFAAPGAGNVWAPIFGARSRWHALFAIVFAHREFRGH